MKSKPFEGRIVIAPNSSARKLMRAARRGKLPSELLRKIAESSTEEARQRHPWYRRKIAGERLRDLLRANAATADFVAPIG